MSVITQSTNRKALSVLAMMYVVIYHYALGSWSHASASQGHVYMWVCVYVSVTCQECQAKDFAGAVITQCIAFTGPQSYTRQH